MISLAELQRIIPAAGPRAAVYVDHMHFGMREFDINTLERETSFIAQVAHESQSLQRVSENLNYSAEALIRTFPSYFDAQTAEQYARQPERIACRVYANRMGNGPEESGDGWLYRGAGLIQLTGKANQTAAADYFGVSPQRIGDWLRSPEGAARSAAWFFKTHGCNELADRNDFLGITKRINGGTNGYQERCAFYEKARQVLG